MARSTASVVVDGRPFERLAERCRDHGWRVGIEVPDSSRPEGFMEVRDCRPGQNHELLARTRCNGLRDFDRAVEVIEHALRYQGLL